MSGVTIKNVTIGEGKPKIAVPIVGKTTDEVLKEAKALTSLACDIIEWRLDLFEDVINFSQVAELSHKLAELLPTIPLLLTFRTLGEGGGRAFEEADYYELYRYLIQQGACDLLDLELFMSEGQGAEIIELAHAKGIKIIMSNHDFKQTPAQDELISRLSLMAERQADICKIAVMPQSPGDVLTLLSATNDMKQITERPIVTMSMGQLGMMSRIFGEIFGSAITFGAAEQTSAPGQLPVTELTRLLDLVSWQEK